MGEDLTGRVALITGASSGIGEATALALAAAGVGVALCARRLDRLDDLVRRIAAAGGSALAIAGDVVDEAVATAAVNRTIDRHGKIDILVNAAGITQSGGVVNANTDEFRRVLDVNLLATLYTCKAAIGPMTAQGGGDIINLSSLAARTTVPGFSAYSTSKHALNAMTNGMRMEVGGHGIRVCILMPGTTATEIANNVSDPDSRNALNAYMSNEAFMTPRDVADTILFVLAQPRRTNISELCIRPTIETST